MPTPLSRRQFIATSAAALSAAALPSARTSAQPPNSNEIPTSQKFITSYYQFTDESVRTLAAGALPNGPEYLHIFVESFGDTKPRPHQVKSVHRGGESFKFGIAFDLHKYQWRDATDDQLRAWAMEFRAAGLDASAPCDYFAFNEMPDEAPLHPELRAKCARLTRYLASAGGGPQWRGVFYFTQKNLNPAGWVGRSDELWEVLDETCDLVVGERFEKLGFATRHSLQELADFFDVMPKFLSKSGDPRQFRIARDKYAILHSTYYGPMSSNWAGLRSDQSTLVDLKHYLEKLVAATRLSEFGKRRIVFSPLETEKYKLDSRMYGVLAEVIKEDRCGKRA